MRLDLRPISVLVLAGTLGISVSGCTALSDASTEHKTPTSPSAPTLSTADAVTGASTEASEFEQQLPLRGEFASQWTETVGEVEIVRRSDGTVWVTLTNFSTGSSPNLRLYLNEGALLKNADGAWTTDSGLGYDIAANIGTASSQQFEIPGSYGMPEIHSVTVFDYTAPDFFSFGSAALT